MRKALLVGALILFGACEDPTRSSRPDPTPSPTAFVNGGDCPGADDPALPEDAGCVSRVTAGDESLIVYASVNARSRPHSWHILYSSGDRTIEQRLRAGNDYSYPRVVGTSDVDADGRPDWWVKVVDFTSHGAPWSGMNLYLVRGDRLAPLSFEGQPLGIHYGGISRMGEGARCRTGQIVLLRAEAKNLRNTRWRVSERTFAISGATASLHGRSEGVLVIKDYNDPDLDPYYEVDCNGFVFPPRPG